MKNTRPVYSTESGRLRPLEQRHDAAVRAPSTPPADGIVRIFRDRAGRNGKTVTVVRGLPAKDLGERATELKRLCGAGGAVKDGAVEIQGDHRERVAEKLRTMGYVVKLAGGQP